MMINTREMGAGSYPEPHEDIMDIEKDPNYADEYHELEMLDLLD